MNVELVGSEVPFHGKVFDVRVDRLRLWTGREVRRDVVVHPDAVGLLLITPGDRVVLIRQYRRPAAAALWEIPAGKIDGGETPLQAAERELMEECGMTARDYAPIAVFHPSPGICTEKVHLFLAHVDLDDDRARQAALSEEGAGRAGHPLLEGVCHEPEEEILECRTFGLDEADAMVSRGEITDGKTMMALLLARRP